MNVDVYIDSYMCVYVFVMVCVHACTESKCAHVHLHVYMHVFRLYRCVHICSLRVLVIICSSDSRNCLQFKLHVLNIMIIIL